VLSSFDSPHKVLVVTSSGPGEGKTTFAINQAFALGQMAKTVLIDADMRRPSLGQTCGFSTNKPGLSELIAGTLDFAKVVYPVEGTNTDLITSGTIPPNPLELLSSPRFEELLAKLREEYTYIVIDSPPVQAVSDARVIATHATAVAYVVRADRTPYKLIQDGLKQLRQANVPVLGVVLNQVDTKKLSKYYSYKYGYASGYHNYGYGHGYSNSYGSYAASQPN
jgi:capsular exopolysaccharide synthesis family protein